MSREAWAVVDLGFGDAGKGSITDFLVRDRGASLVVRFNGGAQAGHNVVTADGRHHTFSQFGAGLFAGAEGLLGPAFLLHPLGMAVEAEHLERVGVRDPWGRTWVDRRARVITPYQQAALRIRERLRGDQAHGTTGVGIGECVSDGLRHPEERLTAGDLDDAPRVRARLQEQRERKRAELITLGASVDELEIFEDPALIERVVGVWRDVAERMRRLDEGETLAYIERSPRVVFEGAQGVLLDETWGFHPHTTWSDCTFAEAEALAPHRRYLRLGVTRAYAVRHGAGPFPTERAVDLEEPHNPSDGWQGAFRRGALDGVLLRYALEVCGGVDGLAVTCLDHVPRPAGVDAYRTSAGTVRRLDPGPASDLGHRERLGAWLRTVTPVFAERAGVPFVEAATDQDVWLVSEGPTAAHKRWRAPVGAVPTGRP
ncbi:MAG: adenylosuccinate synthetase [Myxococcota bacterium]